MIDDIKEGDFVLIKHKKALNIRKWVYITSVVIKEEWFSGLIGILLKNNSKKNLYTNFRKYPFHNSNCIYQKITDIKDIEELTLIYKLYLLKSS